MHEFTSHCFLGWENLSMVLIDIPSEVDPGLSHHFIQYLLEKAFRSVPTRCHDVKFAPHCFGLFPGIATLCTLGLNPIQNFIFVVRRCGVCMEVCQNGTLFPFRDHGTEQDAGYEEDKTEGSNQQKTPCLKSLLLLLKGGGQSVCVKDVGKLWLLCEQLSVFMFILRVSARDFCEYFILLL